MRSLIAEGVRVQCVVTSPPYWGLRDYGCDGQLGLEVTPQQFVANMVEVFELVRELLADDGTLWLNMGDSYAGSKRGGDTGASGLEGSTGAQDESKRAAVVRASFRRDRAATPRSDVMAPGLKPKDLCGMPWRLAFALQDAGWWLRQDIIWSKPNPMPESVTDRCTKAHEYLFLLAKSEKYFYDAQAIKEPASDGTHPRRANNGVGFGHGYDADARERGRIRKLVAGWDDGPGRHSPLDHAKSKDVARVEQGLKDSTKFGRGPGWRKLAEPGSGIKSNTSFDEALASMTTTRNKRSVWTIPTQPYPEAHFATFPEALVEPCILAGSRPGDIVFDPFMGSGTVASVAQRLGRRWLGSELNKDYIELIERRTRGTLGLELAHG